MADVFTPRKSDGVQAVPAPFIQGVIIPSADQPDPVNSLGLRQPIGFGTTTRRFVSTEDVIIGDEGQSAASLAMSVINGLSQARNAGEAIRFEISGLTGPMGPAGRDGVSGLPGISVLGPAGATGAAGADGFENIDIPIPSAGWEGAWTVDSPGAGSVAWTSFTVTYQGTDYTVASGNTANAYIYWTTATPTALSSSATKTDAIGTNKWLVGYWDATASEFSPAQFTKIINAGHIKALSIDTEHLVASSITTAKINDTDVTDAKLNEDAKPIITNGSNTGTTLPISTPTTVVSVSHPTLGNMVDVLAQLTFTSGSSGGGSLDISYSISYDGTVIASFSTSMAPSSTKVVTLNGVGLAAAGSRTALSTAEKTNGTYTVTCDAVIQVEEQRI